MIVIVIVLHCAAAAGGCGCGGGVKGVNAAVMVARFVALAVMFAVMVKLLLGCGGG